ncbi:hypothetical protein JKF63_07556 [Porcisia hertigi]|uniref:Uncharacterized protein n=1 Tax=Porcisia hertigi TaxID=2761500 RepID=A0A836LM38_9TRYP|nr:hypothetical protein JKF63_07556 [Porcisia hertigi]
MPPRTGGLRRPTEEKALLAELSKMFHILKAKHKERRYGRESGAASGKAEGAPRRGSQRRSHRGGSVWIVLKGGFSPKSVPSATQADTVATRANRRVVLSERRRAAALKEAEGYINSAWQQAQEAELVGKDGTPTDEGNAYLAEQYAIASRMLCPPATGAQLHQLVKKHCHGVSEDSVTSTVSGPPTCKLTRNEWEDICTREAAIFFRYRTSATPSGTAEDYFKEQQQARENVHYFATSEPATNGGGDIVPTKCIVRIRDSQRDKYTSILSTTKSVSYFKSNFGQVLRKELSGSTLPRGIAADEADSAAGSSGGKGNYQTSQNGGATTNHSRSGKKKRRR